ncbi:MAG: N-acetylmuramoyl-L-alanine amidase-like domain-containing protein [Longimicrobiales bacterium]
MKVLSSALDAVFAAPPRLASACVRYGALLLIGLVLACSRGGPAADASGEAEAAAESEGPGANGGLRVDVTPEDSAIFDETMAWAREQRLDTLEIGSIMAAVGQRFVGKPYIPKTLDPPGPERLIVNLREFDCVTYVESMLAFGRVIRAGEDDFGAFIRELRDIRYRNNGDADYADRLHYFSEWIASNDAKGIVRDITPSLGGVPDTSRIDFMSQHADLYWQLAEPANVDAVRRTETELSALPRTVIPESRIADAAPEIRDGDVIAAATTIEGLDIVHTGLALWVDGKLHLMHAPLVGTVTQISELPLAERIQDIEKQDGIMVARPL